MAALPWLAGLSCKSNRTNVVSSEAFLAPQADGAPSVAVSKLQILRETHRKDGPDGKPDPGGTTDFDGKLLALPPPNLTPMGKIDEDRLLCFDQDTKTLITINLATNQVVKVFTGDQLVGLNGVFKNPTLKPVIGPPAPVKLRNGWLLCYEVLTKSLFAVRADPAGGPLVVANMVLDQSQMQADLFPTGTRKPVTIAQLMEFKTDHLLMVPKNNLAAIEHLIVDDLGDTLSGHFVLGRPPSAPGDPPLPPSIPLMDYNDVKQQTQQVDVDLIDFSPILIPGTQQVLLFDRALKSSAFLVLTITLEDAPVYHSSDVRMATTRDQLEEALTSAKGAPGGTSFQGQFKLTVSFLHPDASLDPGNPNRVPLILAWDNINFFVIAFDFSKATGEADQLSLFSSKTDISNRTDLHFDPELDLVTLDPALLFAVNDVPANRLAFDAAVSELVSMSYDTGQWVVLLHGRDIAAVTGTNAVTFKYIEVLDPPPDGDGFHVRALDAASATIVKVNLHYVPIPVSRP